MDRSRSRKYSFIRSQRRTLLLLLFAGFAGYASRRWSVYLPPPIRKRTGDALWASVVFCVIAFVRPRWPSLKVASVALLIAYGVEFSQLYHRPWIDHIRSYRIGALMLGTTFYWLDQVAYTCGVAVFAVVDALWGWGRSTNDEQNRG